MNELSTMLPRLVHLSGRAGILGGMLFAVAVVLHPLRDGASIFTSGAAYGAIHNLGVFGLMLQTFGLVGLYIREADAMGGRGLASFIVAFFGQLFYMCLLVVDGIANPLLAQFAPELVHSAEHIDPNLLTIVLPALGLFVLGYVVFGVSLLAARAQPRIGSVLITVGAPTYIAGGISIFIIGPASHFVSLIEIAGAIPFALGLALLGLKQQSDVNVVAVEISEPLSREQERHS